MDVESISSKPPTAYTSGIEHLQPVESTPTTTTTTTTTSTTALSSTTEELFRIWQANCLAVTVASSVVAGATNVVTAQVVQKRVTATQVEARNFFAALVSGTSVQVGTLVLTTQASHADSLALLIRTLEPCFTESASLASRWAALSCLVGSIQGCSQEAATVAPRWTVPLIDLLRAFLLPHAGPVHATADDETDDGNVDTNVVEEQIRDTALAGLASLLQCRVDVTHETDQSNMEQQWFLLRLNIARSGVEQRCVQPESDGNTDYYGYSRSSTTGAGLSLLPRSRRSLCFDLVRSAVDAVAKESDGNTDLEQSLQTTIVLTASAEFCKFAASLLHGESDPRCLLQLLTLFDSIQQSFRFLASYFPSSELFDAVAPYYPIQFNPPPNDSHGITRASLRHAVLQILSCSYYDVGRHYEDNMVNLSFGLILETLLPPPEDGPLTYQEQLHALEDVESFLLSIRGTDEQTNCDKLDDTETKKLSDALQSIHESTSLAVSKGDNALAKEVAVYCRVVVARIAVSLENSSSKTQWRVFVEDPVRLLSMRQDNSPSGRIATAYLASLAASGGTKTVRTSLEAGLSQLYNRFAKDQDPSTIASLFYAVGAFFSSCLVAMERATEDGISLYPHPLHSYTNEAIDRIHSVLLPTEDNHDSTLVSLKAAAVRAFESVILASPMHLFADDRIDCILAIVRAISSRLLVVTDMNETSDAELLSASSITVGKLLGKALDTCGVDENSGSTVALSPNKPNINPLNAFLIQDFFPACLASVKIRRAKETMLSRNDNKTLALATGFSIRAASQIVQSLAEALHSALLGSNYANAAYVADAMCFLFGLNDGFAVRAYQEMSPPSVTAFDIMKSIVPTAPIDDDGIESDFGMSNLQLPKTNDDRQKTEETLEKAYAIVRLLRRGYEFGISAVHFGKLVAYVNHFLPPLNDSDVVQLSVALPFLSAAMECAESELSLSTIAEKSICDDVRGMGRDLAEFSIASEYFPLARSHAARCLHEIIASFTPRNAQVCPSRQLMANIVTRMKESMDNTPLDTETEGLQLTASFYADCLNMIAVLGSAAARRGGSSSKTSDSIIQFLIDLACTQKASLRLVGEGNEEVEVQLEPFSRYDFGEQTRLSIRAASAFGSILSTGSRNSLWQQRLTHISFNLIMGNINLLGDASTGFSSSRTSLGFLAVLCHAVCASNLQNVPSATLAAAAEALTSSLSPSRLHAVKQVDTSIPELILAALLKLMSFSPSSFPNIYPSITGSLHAFASAVDLDERSEIVCKILALQTIAGVTQLTSSPELLKSMKPAVVSILSGATNHPSGLLRIAAGEVRNAWFFVE